MHDTVLSGRPEELAHGAVRIVQAGPRHESVYDVFMHLLATQYILSTVLGFDQLWEVRKGSSVGLIGSSAVADDADLARLEDRIGGDLGFLCMAAYFRFSACMFVVVSGRNKFRQFYQEYELRSKYFDVLIEKYSSYEV